MSLNINLSPESEARLRAAAESRGVEPGKIVEEWIETFTPANGHSLSPEDHQPTDFELAVQRLNNRTPEQVAQDQKELLALATPALDPPEGQTWLDAIAGQWPGDETDEEIEEILKRLS